MGGVRADELLGGIENSHSTADGDMGRATWSARGRGGCR